MRRALTLVFAVALGGCQTTSIDFLERQPKAVAYRASDLFLDGRAMRPLVEGTVARERRLFANPAITTGKDSGGDLTRIPLPVTRATLEQGRRHYDTTCAMCHGLLGDSDTMVAHKMALRPPPSLVIPPVSEQAVGHQFRVISEGYGVMPSYAAEIDVEDRWAVVAYLRALRLSQSAPLDRAPPEVRRRLEGR
jgi:hypothetical protein